jgi:hypothetical protein
MAVPKIMACKWLRVFRWGDAPAGRPWTTAARNGHTHLPLKTAQLLDTAGVLADTTANLHRYNGTGALAIVVSARLQWKKSAAG